MSTLRDHSLAVADEATYAAGGTFARFLEMLKASKPAWDPQTIRGQGLRPAAAFQRASRSYPGYGQGKVPIEIEVPTIGMGELLNASMGDGASHKVGTGESTTYQRVWTSALSGNVLPSIAVQFGITAADDAGTTSPYTFKGCTVNGWSLESSSAKEFLKFGASLDARTLDRTTSLTTWAGPDALNFFTQWDSAIYIGGTLTEPTDTALGSMTGSAIEAGIVRSWKLSVDNKLGDSAWGVGGRGRPRVGGRIATLELDVEHRDNTLRDAMFSQDTVAVLLQHTGAALSTGHETLQIAVPAALVDDGPMPEPTDGEVFLAKVKMTLALDDDDHPAFYVASRTSEDTLP